MAHIGTVITVPRINQKIDPSYMAEFNQGYLHFARFKKK